MSSRSKKISLFIMMFQVTQLAFSQKKSSETLIHNVEVIEIMNPLLITIKKKNNDYYMKFVVPGNLFEEITKVTNPEGYINCTPNAYIFLNNCKFGSLRYDNYSFDSLIKNSYYTCEILYDSVPVIGERIYEKKKMTIDKLGVDYFVVGIINSEFYNKWFIERYTTSERKLININTFIPFAVPYVRK